MRRAVQTLLLTTLGLALVIAGVALSDASGRPGDHSPLRRPSALDEGSWPKAEEAACAPRLPDRLIVVGWDSADWGMLLPLLQAGDLPNLEALMAEGTSGTLATFLPSVSPALWTTVATGVSPDRHGILGFYARKPRLARWWDRLTHFGRIDRRLFSSSDRHVRAIWNLMSDARRPVLVVGYHNTFPVEDVEGVMVSNYLTQDSIGQMMEMGVAADAELARNLVDPPQLLDSVLAVQREVETTFTEAARRFSNATGQELEALVERGRALPATGDQRPWFLLHAYAFDEINARTAETLYPHVEPDLAFVHFQAVDWAAHQFLVFHRPEAYADAGWSAETRRHLDEIEPLYRDTVREYYRYLDEWLGRLMALRGPGTAMIVLSDHGTGSGDDPETPGNHDDGPPGMIVLSGPGIRSGARVEGASLYDVMPTLAALLGLPQARDLPGAAIEDAFCPGAWSSGSSAFVDTYTPEAEFRPPAARPAELQDELLKQLEALGYLDE